MLGPLKRSLLNLLGSWYRTTCLKRPVFIAVTGSCGKTTTKELTAAILSSKFRGRGNPGTCNTPYHVVRIILKTNPRDDFCVLEVAGADREVIPLEQPLGLIRPKIGVITNINMDHFTLFGSLEAIAAHKGKLVEALPVDGTAVLNADDSRVLAMQSRCSCRVITYGLSPAAMLRAENISSDWPNRLSFTSLYDGQSIKVETQLCGTHWVPNVLAAMAVGEAMGVPLSEAAEAIRKVSPVDGRYCPVTTSNGITFIRDDQKAPLWTIPASLQFMRGARAPRKVLVLGTISDYQGNPARKYPQVARQALEVADVVVFVSHYASMALRARRHANDRAIYAFDTVNQLSGFLHGFFKSW